ncbi:hypothetical protein [Streptomyces boncukensis]|uniref:hypothetical protein n=1 Tax=Streptomyces boncukensis TaxID=2711219 RepID=UPI0019D2A0DF|nr:hypothetical protein [Streptomyces boncukensis]
MPAAPDDAGWYVREGDHKDPDDSSLATVIRPPRKQGRKGKANEAVAGRDKKVSLKTKYLFGYDAHLVVARDTTHGDALLDGGTPNPGPTAYSP